MADSRGGSERKNYIIKTLLIVILLLLALLSTVFYVYAYPKSTITLYSICGGNQEKEEVFQIKKYSSVGSLKPIEKLGYKFQYWAYDMAGTKEFDGDAEVDVDYLDLFGMYEVKEFTVTLHIQEYDGETKLDKYTTAYTYKNIQFNTYLELWDGIDKTTGELDSRLSARTGYDFVGWTTKVQEEDVISDSDVIRVGDNGEGGTYSGKFWVLQDSDIDLYAYWEKRSFDIVSHTGNEYLSETPSEETGEFIIRNNTIDNQGLGIKYLNSLSSVTSVANASLIEENGVIIDEATGYNDNNEYEFKGWYLDYDYTIPATDDLIVKISEVDKKTPYLVSDTIANPSISNAVAVARYNEDTHKYEFDLYSKWERKSYTLSFKKNLSGAGGVNTQIASVTVYRYDDHYGKYYQTLEADKFTRENADSNYFCSVDLSCEAITSNNFLTAFSSYRFMGWSEDIKADSETSTIYYKWTQNKTYTVDGYEKPDYSKEVYTHRVSEDVTLYAQWSTLRTVTFYQKSSASNSTSSFTVTGVAGEWFVLPTTAKVVNELGWTNKSYNFFAGWKSTTYTSSSNSNSIIYEYEKGKDANNDGKDDATGADLDQNLYILNGKDKVINQNYIHIIGTNNLNFNYYAYWENKVYTVEFYRNDGTENLVGDKPVTVKGGNNISFPASPTRENYIFDGWSTTRYEDNTLGKSVVNSVVMATGEELVIKYYASWTMNFTVSYDANGGTVSRTMPTIQYATNGKNLTLEVTTLNASSYISNTGNTFDGWLLKTADGGWVDLNIGQRETYIFNFQTNKFYKKQQSGTQYDFVLGDGEGNRLNEVVLFAKWKANEYKITIIDGITSAKTTFTAKYGSGNLDISQYITDHLGYKFTHLSTSRSGSDVAIEPLDDGSVLLPESSILSNLTFYAIYELRNITLSYKIVQKTGTSITYEPTASIYSKGIVKYGDTLILPTPDGARDYGDGNFLFKYWYYLDGEENEVIVENGSKLKYDDSELVLWAKFEEQRIYLQFKFVNPLNSSDIVVITTADLGDGEQTISIQKGEKISSELYTAINDKIEELIKDIHEYTYNGLFYYYFGSPYKFFTNEEVPSQDSSGTIMYTTTFSANAVNFVYEFVSSGDAGKQTKTAHTGNTYDSKSDIILENVKDLNFSYGEGEGIISWYLLKNNDTDNDKYPLQLGDYLIKTVGSGDYFRSIADMSKYIVWEYNTSTGKYEGTITIHAETEKNITITYYAIASDGQLKQIKRTDLTYDAFGNSLSLLDSSDALVGFEKTSGLQFNGWRVYNGTTLVTSLGDEGLVSGVLNIDVDSIFTNYDVKLYADISYIVSYEQIIENGGAFAVTSLKEDVHKLATSDFYNVNSYKLTHSLSTTPVSVDSIPSGYEYYGYKIGTKIYSMDAIGDGINLEVAGDKIEILCYIARVINITYTLGSSIEDEKFADGETSDKVEKFVLDYENNIIAMRTDSGDVSKDRITVSSIQCEKAGYSFIGWSIISDGQTSNEVLQADEELYIYNNVTLVAIFKEPDQASLTAKFVYKYVNASGEDVTCKEVSIPNANGTTQTLLDPSSVTVDAYSGVTGWMYQGQTLEDGLFSVPLLIKNNQEFEFIAIVKTKYTIKFETYSRETVSDLVIYDGVEYRLNSQPTLDNESKIVSWAYYLDSEEEPIEIAYNDAIIFRASTEDNQVVYSCTRGIEYDLHIIPAKSGYYTYTFYAIGEDITLVLDSGVEDASQVTLEHIAFGHTFSARDLVKEANFERYETQTLGIVAWTTDSNKTSWDNYTETEQEALADNITNISTNRTLYAVWQSKYTITYAPADDTFGYRDSSNLDNVVEITPDVEYYFAGDTISFNASVLKSVYYKGYNTVYYDNGTYIVYVASSNDYYMVTGYTYTYNGTTKTMNIDQSFDMPGANTEIKPIFEKAFKVSFYENTTTGDPVDSELLFSAYAVDLSTIDLSLYIATRDNFTFLGWSDSRDGEAIESLTKTSADINLYAVWESNISIVFTVNGEATIFRVPITREGKINKTILSNYLSMEQGTSENGYFNWKKLNDNTRTYNYNNINYYLSYFACNNRSYTTIDDICNVVFTRATTVNMILDKVYTINYGIIDDYGNTNLIDGKVDYFVKVNGNYGVITNDSCSETLTFEEYTDKDSSEFYTATGWKDGSQKLYLFGSSATSVDLEYLAGISEDREVTLTLNLEAKGITIKLYTVDDPYAVFSQFAEDGSDISSYSEWKDVASTYVKDYSGNTISGNPITLPYGSNFTLAYPTTPTNNYQIIGWSTSILKLGATSTSNSNITIYYCYNYTLGNGIYSGETLTLNKAILNENNALILYPVYQLVTMHDVSIHAIDGEFTYALANDTSKCIGYVSYLDNEKTGKLSALDCEYAYYQTLTITANSPKTNYNLKSFTHNGEAVDGVELVLTGSGETEHVIEIVYEPKSINITLKLQYSKNLLSGNDNSTIKVNNVILSSQNSETTISVLSNVQLSVVSNLSEYYVIKSIMSGENNITLIDSAIDISNLTIDEGDNATIIFTLSPKTHTVSLNLQGGSVSSFTYTSSIFGSGDVEIVNNIAEVIAGSQITISDPVKEGNKYAFMYYTIDGAKYEHISNYTINSDISVVAFFMQNMFTITYKFNGGNSLTIDFVGGSTITIGVEDMSKYIMAGIEHKGWMLEGDNTVYTDGTSFATSKKNYTFYEVTKGKTVTITFETTDETKLNTTSTFTVEYGTEFTLPEASFITTTIEGKGLYGFTDSVDATNIIKPSAKASISTAVSSSTNLHFAYAENITIYAVYYTSYVYTFEYVTTYGSGDSAITSSTLIATETKTIVATSSTGNVLATDLTHVISSVIPVPNDENMTFAGYILSINGEYQKENGQLIIINAGDKLGLVNPANNGYIREYKYILYATYESTVNLKALDVVVTNPFDEEKILKLTVDSTEKDSYTIRANESIKLYMSSLPIPDYITQGENISWKIGDNVVFTTAGRDIIAYKVIGYTCEYLDANGDVISNLTKRITLNSEDRISVADGNSCRLTTIWEVRYKVTYHDDNGNETSSEYYDRDTLLTVDDADKYSKADYVFVGYADSLNKSITSTNDFLSLGATFVTNQDYNFYPAFSKIYTAIYHDNQSLLEGALGTWAKAQKIVQKNLEAYIGMPAVQLLDYYAWYYNDIGYTFAGLTVTPDTLANDLEDGLLDTSYTLDYSHLVNDKLHIYVAWMVEEDTITYVITSIKNDNNLSYYDTTTLEMTYRFNETITLDYDQLIERFNALSSLNSDTRYIIDNFEFTCFSTTRDGGREITTYLVQSDANIYLIFNHRYTIVYNIGEATYVSDDVSRVEDQMATTGATITGYDADENLYLVGRGDLYWTPVYNSDIHFFDENDRHTFAESDRKYASENYVITLYLGSSVAQYTVNLNFYSNIYNFNNNLYTTVTMSLPYGSSIFEMELDEDYEIVDTYSPFDDLIKTKTGGTYTKLYDLFAIFEDDLGYEFTGRIQVNDTYTYLSQDYNSTYYYTVQTYSSATLDAFTNDIYLKYSLISYSLQVRSIVFEKEGDINNPSSGYSTNDITTVLQIRSNTNEEFNNYNVTNQWAYINSGVTRKSDINLIYVDDVALEYSSTNISYTFYGYRAVSLDEDGNILSFKDVQYGDNWSSTYTKSPREDGLYGGYDYIYHAVGDVLVYAIYIERPIMVTLTYVAPDGMPSSEISKLSTKITLNNNVVEDSKLTTVEKDSSLVVTFKGLYGQTLYICDADGEEMNYYVIKNIMLGSGISHGSNAISTRLVDMESLSLSIIFETLKINVYAYTNLDLDLFSFDAYAEIESVEATFELWNKTITISGDDIYEDSILNTSEGKYYNYVIRVPYNAILNISSINARLNNFTIMRWYLHSGTNVTQLGSSLTITSEIFISAEFKANDIDVVFYTSDGQTALTVGSKSNVSYGDKITLPYIVVDEDTHVSMGWKIGDYSYSWGETIYAVNPNNEAITDGTLHICADVTEKYYLVFKNDNEHTFDIPVQYSYANNQSAITLDDVWIDGDAGTYIYYDTKTATYETNPVDEYTTLFSTKFNLPSELKFDTSFGGWLVKSGDIIADYYVFDKNDITEDNIITLTTTLSGMVAVKFYITDPTDTTKTLSLATTSNGDYTIACIQVFFDIDNDDYIGYITISEAKSNIIKWSSGYFTKTNIEDLLSSYEFYGWSTSRLSVLNNPSAQVSSFANNSSLLYGWELGSNGRMVRTSTSSEDRSNQLVTLIKQANSDYTFYSVWEKKKTVVFDASDTAYENATKIEGKYAEGERIELPSNLVDKDSDIYIDLVYNTNKWVGWKSDTTTYLFDEYSYIYAPSVDTVFTPEWSAGTKVYFDMNFDNVREYYSYILSISGTHGAEAEILNNVGYPYLVADDTSSYIADTTKKLNALVVDGRLTEYTFATRYREGSFWSDGMQVPVYKYNQNAFSQKGIFTTAGTLDQYFDLVGWMYNGEIITTIDDEGRIVFNIDSSMVGTNSSIILYAVWKPIDIEVSFYYDKTSAENEDSGNRYGTSIDDEFSYITVKVPFGYKLTIVEGYAKFTSTFATNNIQYLYSGIAEGMNAPENLSVPISEREFYRFDYWMDAVSNSAFFNNVAVDDYSANTISEIITSEVNLYPVFKTIYTVEFVSTDGELLSEDISQTVVTGEYISISDKLSSVLDVKILSEVYYFNNGGGKVSVKDKEKVLFDDTTFTIYDRFYVYIYVNINIMLNAYVPTYEGNNVTATQYGDGQGIYQNVTYTIREYFSISDYYIRDKYGNDDGYPSFAGWFVSTSSNYYTSDDAYRVDINNASTIRLITEKTGSKINYFIVINGDNSNRISVTPQSNGLVINIYAKFYTTTTISLGSYSDQSIISYAELTYDTSDSNVGNKYFVETTQWNGKIKTITYQTAYNSPYAPDIIITPAYGYKISNISGLDSDTLTTLNDKTQITNLSYAGQTYKVIMKKSTSTTSDDYMKLTYTMNVVNVNKTSNLKFVVDLTTINYTVTYTYDTTKTSTLMYQTSSGTRWTSFNDTNGEISFAVDSNNTSNGNRPEGIYNNANVVSKFTVKYTVATVGTSKSITITNVPYGYTLYITAIASDTLMHHFGKWDVAESEYGYGDESELGRYVQIFTPSGMFDNSNYNLNIHLDTVMYLNDVQTITYVFKFSDYSTSDAWHNVLKSGSTSTILSLSGSTYTYTWTPSGTTNGVPSGMTVKAGDSLENLFAKILEIYNNTFNMSVGTVDTSFDSIEGILNYFWFNNIWTSEINRTSDCRLVDNIVGVSEAGNLYIYTQLEKAVLINALHQVQDYVDSNTILYDANSNKIDRADISLNGVAYLDNNKQTHTAVENLDFFVLAQDSNNIAVKMPYGHNITIGVTPDGATSTHVAYKLAGWNIIDCDNETIVSASGNSCTLDTSTYSNFVRFSDGYTVPEMHFSANVVAETYQLTMLNDDGSKISTLEIAYDKALENKYPQYSYSLGELRDVSVNKLPLFTLDVNNSKITTTTFLSSYDQSAGARSQGYGFYKYLFETWVDSSGNAISSTNDGKLKSFSNGNYQNITITAKYYENTAITYGLIDENSVENLFTRYLPNGEFKDEFGNVYYDVLLWDSVVADFEDGNIRYSLEGKSKHTLRLGTGDYNYYTGANLGGLYICIPSGISTGTTYTSSDYVKVERVSDIADYIANGTYNGQYIVYPSIDVALDVNNRGTLTEYTVRSVGGTYYTNMTENGALNFYNMLGIYQNGSKLNKTYIAFTQTPQQQFAYWQVWDYMGSSVLYNLASTPYPRSSEVKYVTHYNAMLNITLNDPDGKGGVTGVLDKNGNNITLSGTKLSNQNLTSVANVSKPSKVYIDSQSVALDDKEIEYLNIEIVKDGFTLYVQDHTNTNNVTTLYSITFAYDPSKNNNIPESDIMLVWQIYNENSEIVGELLNNSDSETVLDSWGRFTISPVIYPKEVEVTVTNDLYIYNVNSNYQSLYGSLITSHASTNTSTFTVQGGASLITDNELPYECVTNWSSALYFRPINNTDALSSLANITASPSGSINTYYQNLAKYTYNWRWQYYYNNAWQDIKSEATRINGNNGATSIRLACDWKEITVTIGTVNVLSVSGTYNGKDTAPATKSGSSMVNSSMSGNQKSFTITMLAGDTISYDSASETITLNSDGAWDTYSQIIFTAYVVSGEYSQGWFSVYSSGKNNGLMDIAYESKTIKFDDGQLTFGLWTEKAVNISAVVDRDKYYINQQGIVENGSSDNYTNVVNGYGNVTILQTDVKGGNPTNVEGTYDQGKTLTYLSQTTMGVSSALNFKFEDNSQYRHKFLQATYIDGEGNGQTITSNHNFFNLFDLASDTTFSVLYDASSTATQYTITDKDDQGTNTTLNARFQTTIYGGYTINYNESNANSTSHVIQITIKDMFAETKHTLYVYMKAEGTDTATKIYPRHNFRADVLKLYSSTSALGFDGGYEIIGSTSLSGAKAVANLEYLSDSGSLVVFMDEYLYAIDFLLSTSDTDTGIVEYIDTDKVSFDTNSTLNIEKTYSAINGKLTAIRLTGLDTSTYFTIGYNRSSGYQSMVLTRVDSSSAEYLFTRVGKYNLLGLDIYSIDDTIIKANNYYSNTSDSNSEFSKTRWSSQSNALTSPQYKLVVRVQNYIVTQVGFKLTLPYLSDLRELNISSNLFSVAPDGTVVNTNATAYNVDPTLDSNSKLSGIVAFNNIAGKGTLFADEDTTWANKSEGYSLDVTFLTHREVSVKAEISDNTYTLRFYTSSNPNNSYGYISYTLPAIYSVMGGLTGWYVDNSTDYNNMIPSTTLGYKSWQINTAKLTYVGTTQKVSLGAETSIVLAVKRNTVDIYVDTSATWWLKQNNTTTLDNTEYNRNIDVNEYLQYSYMQDSFPSTSGIAHLTTYGGLVSAYPLDYNSSIESAYGITNNTTDTIRPQNFTSNIRTGVYIQMDDSTLVGRSSTAGTKYICTSSAIDNSAVCIVGNNDGYNVELNTSTTWYIAGIPSGDSNANGSNYRLVTFADSLDGTNFGTFSFVNGNITLLQSFVGWNTDDYSKVTESQKQFTIYLAKDTSTRLYNGMYVSSTGYTPIGYSYARVSFTFSTTQSPTSGKHIVLTGYEVYSSSGTHIGTISYEMFKSSSGAITGACILDLSKYSAYSDGITLCPVWESKGVFTIKFTDSKGAVSEPAQSVLEGSSITKSITFSTKQSLTNSVSTTSTSASTYNVLSKNGYIFMGFNTVKDQMYGTSSTDTAFKSYGAYRIKYASSTYSIETNTKVKNGVYTLTLTDISSDYEFFAIWQKLGYTVKYQFNGKTSISTTDTLKSSYKDSKETKCNTTISYSNYLEGMPYRISVDYTTSNFSDTKYKPASWSIGSYFTDSTGNKSVSVNTLKFKATSTIYFSLTHNKGHGNSYYSNSAYYSSTPHNDHLCSTTNGSKHGYDKYTYYECIYCSNSAESTHTPSSCSTKTEVKSKNDTKHTTYTYCNCSVCKGKNRQTKDPVDANHSKTTTDTATCIKSGKKITTCSKCDYSKVLSNNTPALGHEITAKVVGTMTMSRMGKGWYKVGYGSYQNGCITDDLGNKYYSTSLSAEEKSYYQCSTGKYAWCQTCQRCDLQLVRSGNAVYDLHYGDYDEWEIKNENVSNSWGHSTAYSAIKEDNSASSTKTCSYGHYYRTLECTRAGCGCNFGNVTEKRSCEYSYQNFQLVSKSVTYPDKYNCNAIVWLLKFPCTHCANTYYQSEETGEDYAIRLRVNSLSINSWSSSYATSIINDKNTIAKAQTHVAESSGILWAKTYSCSECGCKLEKEGNAYVMVEDSTHKINYPTYDYMLEFQPNMGMTQYVWSGPGMTYGYGAAAHNYSWEITDNSGYANPWKYWTEKSSYGGWWALVDWAEKVDGQTIRSYRTVGVSENGYGLYGKWVYHYCIYYQTIKQNSSVTLTANKYIPSDFCSTASEKFVPNEVSSDYKGLIQNLSRYLFFTKDRDKRNDIVKARKKNAGLQITASYSSYIYT